MTPTDLVFNGRELVFTGTSIGEVSIERIVQAVEDIDLLVEFIEDSGLREEFKEFKVFRKLRE